MAETFIPRHPAAWRPLNEEETERIKLAARGDIAYPLRLELRKDLSGTLHKLGVHLPGDTESAAVQAVCKLILELRQAPRHQIDDRKTLEACRDLLSHLRLFRNPSGRDELKQVSDIQAMIARLEDHLDVPITARVSEEVA